MSLRKRPPKKAIDYSKYTRGRWPPVTRLLRAEWDFVMDIAKRCGVAHGERQDVALEVFLRYHLYRWSIVSPMAIRSWLRTTTIHVAADVKNRKTSRFEVPFDPEELEPEDLSPSPEEELSALEGHRDLMKLVDALEPGRREVFYRYADQHQAMSLLSAELGIAQGTAYNRLRLAREELRTALDREAQARARQKKRRGFAVVSFLLFLREEAIARVWRAAREAWRAGREAWGGAQEVRGKAQDLGRALRDAGVGLARSVASGGRALRAIRVLFPLVAAGALIGFFPALFTPGRDASLSLPPPPPPQTGTLAANGGEEEQDVSRSQGVSDAQMASSSQAVFDAGHHGDGGRTAQIASDPPTAAQQQASNPGDSPSRQSLTRPLEPPTPDPPGRSVDSLSRSLSLSSDSQSRPTSPPTARALDRAPGSDRPSTSTPTLAAQTSIPTERTSLQRGPLRLAHARLVAFAKRHPPSPYPEIDRPVGAPPPVGSVNSL